MKHESAPELPAKEGLPWLRDESANFLLDALRGGFFKQMDPRKRRIIAQYALTPISFEQLSQSFGLTSDGVAWHAETGIHQMWNLMPDELREKHDPSTLLPIKSIGWHMVGKKLTQDVKDKMSDSQKGHRHTDATKEKLRQQKMGHTVSDEARGKMSKAAKNRKRVPLSETTKKKISDVKKEKNRIIREAREMQQGMEIWLG